MENSGVEKPELPASSKRPAPYEHGMSRTARLTSPTPFTAHSILLTTHTTIFTTHGTSPQARHKSQLSLLHPRIFAHTYTTLFTTHSTDEADVSLCYTLLALLPSSRFATHCSLYCTHYSLYHTEKRTTMDADGTYSSAQHTTRATAKQTRSKQPKP